MRFTTVHYLIPFIAITCGIVAQYTGLDMWLAQQFYDPQSHTWPYKEAWFPQQLIHRSGRDVLVWLAVATLVFFILTLFVVRWRQWRRTSGYLLLASLSCVILVGQLKGMTHIYSPWVLQAFGRSYPHIRLFDSVSPGSPIGFAFPAGHASGGYALLSVYFLLYQTTHRYRYVALVIALLTGVIFGLAQQMRGAHMLSHDLFTLAICWAVCMAWATIMFHLFSYLFSEKLN